MMGERNRDFSIRKAKRKKRICDYYHWNREHPYYDNLHQYSKNKIHCSCSDCNPKTARDGYTNTDRKKLLNLEEQLNEGE